MQRLCTPTARDQLAHLEQVHRCLLPLQDIFTGWHHAGVSTGSEALAQRERLLSDLASRYVDDLPERLSWHAPTLSAAQTQAVLPHRVGEMRHHSTTALASLLLKADLTQADLA